MLCVCVCVCVLDLWMLCIFLLRDVFESLKCWLDLWLSSLLVAFISMCFSSFWKTVFYQARQLLDRSSIASCLSSLLDFFSRQILSHIRSIELFGICLDSFSIHRESFYPADKFSTEVRSIELILSSTNSRKLLDRFISVEI